MQACQSSRTSRSLQARAVGPAERAGALIHRPAARRRRIDPVDAHVGTRIRMRRRELKKTADWLGGEIGMTSQGVCAYESGAVRVGCSVLAQIAAALHVTPAFFFDGLSAPGQSCDTAAAENVSRLMALDGGPELARFFTAIESRHVRQQIVDIAGSLAAAGPQATFAEAVP